MSEYVNEPLPVSDEEVVAVNEVEVEEEPVTEEVEEVAEEEPVSTQEVVQNVQEMLTTEPVASVESTSLEERVKVLEERLEKLVKILQSSYSNYEYDDDKFRWTHDMLYIRENLNEL